MKIQEPTKQVSKDENYPISICIKYFDMGWNRTGVNRLNNEQMNCWSKYEN